MLLKSDNIKCLIIQVNETIYVATTFSEVWFICYMSSSCASHGQPFILKIEEENKICFI